VAAGGRYNGGMVRLCHRCHAELPGDAAGYRSSGSSASDDEHALFCPRCGAPQILLPEYMRAEVAATAVGSTTGAVPPPRPQMVEWTVVLRCVAPLAVVTAVLAVAALVSAGASFLLVLCVLSGAGVVLGLYRARRPLARIDGRVGLRVGMLTGIAMIAAMGVALAITGVVERFGVHGMAGFDDQLTKEMVQSQQLGMKMAEQVIGPGQDAQMKQKEAEYATSPEVRAADVIFGLFVRGAAIVAIMSALGAFSGALQMRRRALRGRN